MRGATTTALAGVHPLASGGLGCDGFFRRGGLDCCWLTTYYGLIPLGNQVCSRPCRVPEGPIFVDPLIPCRDSGSSSGKEPSDSNGSLVNMACWILSKWLSLARVSAP